MSYILDALKKSERERSLGNIPTLDTIGGEEREGHRVRRWLVGSILALFIAALGTLFLMMPDEKSDKVEEVAASVKSLAKSPTTTEPEQPPPASTQLPKPRQEVISVTVPATTKRSAQDMATTEGAVPLLEELPPQVQRKIPKMALNVVSYSEDPARRFVMIDLAMYKEGQIVSSGPRVDGITADGVILSYQGTRFLLRP